MQDTLVSLHAISGCKLAGRRAKLLISRVQLRIALRVRCARRAVKLRHATKDSLRAFPAEMAEDKTARSTFRGVEGSVLNLFRNLSTKSFEHSETRQDR